jgi:AbrB family looped-hinge helix DNA binding protein
MHAVTVSPKFQVVIPKPIRTKMGLMSGEKLQIISYDDRIELVRATSVRETRGFLKGLDSSFEREREERV